MRYFWFLIIVFLWSSNPVFAQEEESAYTISTDRSSVGFSSSVVPKGVLQLETGLYGSRLEAGLGGYQAIGLATLRYHVVQHLEVRLNWGGYGNYTDFDGDSFASGSEVFSLGVKQLFFQSESGLELSSLAEVTLPFSASKELQPSKPTYYVLLLGSMPLGESFSAYFNTGYQSTAGFEEVLFLLGSGVSFTEKLSAFVEFAGYFSEDSNRILPNAGLVYLINDKHQIDLTLGGTIGTLNDTFLHIGWSTYFGSAKF